MPHCREVLQQFDHAVEHSPFGRIPFKARLKVAVIGCEKIVRPLIAGIHTEVQIEVFQNAQIRRTREIKWRAVGTEHLNRGLA